MILTTTKFTPEVLISAPRRSPAMPNPTGTKALYTVSTYSFATHSKTSQIRLLDIGTGQSAVLYESSALSEPTWLDETDFVMLRAGEKGATSLVVASVVETKLSPPPSSGGGTPGGTAATAAAPVGLSATDPREIRSFNGSLSNLRVAALDSEGTFAVVVSAPTTPSGAMYFAEEEVEGSSSSSGGGNSTGGKATRKTAPSGTTGANSHSSGKVYTSLYVRHWDSYVTENKNSLWYGAVKKAGDQQQQQLTGTAKAPPLYTFRSRGLTNLLSSSPERLVCPVPPFGGTGDFDVGRYGVVFTARDPALDPATHTKTDLYFVALSTFAESSPPEPRMLLTPPELRGYSMTPRFSPATAASGDDGGRRVAFTRQRSARYEADKNRLLVLDDVTDPDAVAAEFFATPDGAGGWDARPESVLWSADGSALYCVAEDSARARLYRVQSSRPDHANFAAGVWTAPQLVVTGLSSSSSSSSSSSADDGGGGGGGDAEDAGAGGVRDVSLLRSADAGDGRLLVSCSSLVDSSWYAVLDPEEQRAAEGFERLATLRPAAHVLSSVSHSGRSFGLSRRQISSIWADTDSPGGKVHALVVMPSESVKPASSGDSSTKKKYPLAFLVHGGPQGAWLDDWSVRWNAAIFAEAGYAVVMPNPTGSTGYGQLRTDSIAGQWGGYPYRDLVAVMDHVESSMGDVVDVSRAVALGASYGGYMINWIQGNELGRRFRALVCHDGVFSTLNQWATEELFFPLHDFAGTLWENREGYERWDPARMTAHWDTPQMVIHNELDYRLPISEGLSAFNVLQARGVPSKFLTFPDENHWVLKPENGLVWYTEVLKWINHYSGIEKDAEEDVLAQETEKLVLS